MCTENILCYAKLLQSCLILCDLMDCSPSGSSVHGDSPGKNTRVGCHFLLQIILVSCKYRFLSSKYISNQHLDPGLQFG